MLGFSSQRSSPHSHSYTRTIEARRTSEIIAARRTSPLHLGQCGGAAETDGSCALTSTLSSIPRSVTSTLTLTTNHFRVFATSNQNDFGIVSLPRRLMKSAHEAARRV